MSNENNKIVAKGQHGNKKYKITSEEFNCLVVNKLLLQQ